MTARQQCKRWARCALDLETSAAFEPYPPARFVLRVRAQVADWISGYWAARARKEIP